MKTLQCKQFFLHRINDISYWAADILSSANKSILNHSLELQDFIPFEHLVSAIGSVFECPTLAPVESNLNWKKKLWHCLRKLFIRIFISVWSDLLVRCTFFELCISCLLFLIFGPKKQTYSKSEKKPMSNTSKEKSNKFGWNNNNNKNSDHKKKC